MEVERQVNRQRGSMAGNKGGGKGGTARGAKGGGGRQRATAPSAAAVRAKARNLGGVTKSNTPASGGPIKAPSQQAIGAAAKAMKDYGFKPPKGMQMQISFVPKKEPVKTNNTGGGRGGRSNAGRQSNNNNNNNQNSGGRGGGRGRGGRGGRGRGRR